MLPESFDHLLAQADASAQRGDWLAAFDHLQSANRLVPDHTGVLTGMGTCLIQLSRAPEAILYFQQVTALAPDSPEAFNNLGVAQALDGQLDGAEAAYQQAITLAPEHQQAWKNLAVVYLRQARWEEGVPILAALIKDHPQDVESLDLLAQCYEAGGEIESARALYQQILSLDSEHEAARAALARLTPAASPDRIARPEHAKKLAALKGLKQDVSAQARAAQSVVIYAPDELADSDRMKKMAETLAGEGWTPRLSPAFDPADLGRDDLLVFAQPHFSGNLLAGVSACIQSGKPFAIDLVQDDRCLPVEHPLYSQLGPGNPRAAQTLEVMLREAQWVSLTSPALAERFRPQAKEVKVILPAWSHANPLWEKPCAPHITLNIGWIGNPAERGDLLAIRPDLLKILRAVPQSALVIAGDGGAYERFHALPEARRQFLPAASSGDIPYLLAQLDILIIPWRASPWNQTRSDQPLMQAGIRRVPWVATPIPAYKAWEAGGLFAEKAGDWYTALKKLALDPGLRKELGEAGREKAKDRQLAE